jgi:hypothetical protein
MPPRTSKGPTHYDLPENAFFIEFPDSDGDAGRYPLNTTRVVDAAGEVNFMQFLDSDSPICKKWRHHIGTAVGKELQLGGMSYLRLSFKLIISARQSTCGAPRLASQL